MTDTYDSYAYQNSLYSAYLTIVAGICNKLIE